MSNTSKILRLTFAVLLAATLSAVAMAQSTTSGAIGGMVTNPNKEVVPGASVTVVNTATNKEDGARETKRLMPNPATPAAAAATSR